MNIAKSLEFDMSIEATLPIKCHSFRKRQYDDNDNNEQIQSFEKSFRVNLFLVVVNMTITSVKILKIFKRLEVFENIVGFYLMQEP